MLGAECLDRNGECFARMEGKCTILENTKFPYECPFKKPYRERSGRIKVTCPHCLKDFDIKK